MKLMGGLYQIAIAKSFFQYRNWDILNDLLFPSRAFLIVYLLLYKWELIIEPPVNNFPFINLVIIIYLGIENFKVYFHYSHKYILCIFTNTHFMYLDWNLPYFTRILFLYLIWTGLPTSTAFPKIITCIVSSIVYY